MIKYLTLITLFITVNSYAQHNISGRVIDKANNKPIANAVVFLNKTGIATNTKTDGTFVLKNAPEGHYQLLVTLIGYESSKVLINITGDLYLNDISIAAKTEDLKEVVVKSKTQLSPYFYLFRSEFLGNNTFARQCKILNPAVIHFYDTNQQGDYSAKSNGFINLQNDALGYNIKILLTSFVKKHTNDSTSYTGDSYFEEMKGTPEQVRTWKKNRMECYQGSMMQFLRAVLSGTTKQEGYKIKKAFVSQNAYYDPIEIYDDPMDDPYLYKIRDTVVNESDILSKTNKPGLFALTRDGRTITSCLYVEFHEPDRLKADGKKEPRIPWIWQSTDCFILFEKPYVVFDYHGVIDNIGDIKFSGFFGEQVMSYQLPVDFDPSEQQL
jgi:hypothetical protein